MTELRLFFKGKDFGPPIMGRFILTFVVTLLLILVSLSPVSATEESNSKKILVLLAGQRGLPWQESVYQTIEDHFSKIQDLKVTFEVEHLDILRHPSEEYIQQLHALFHLKYSGMKFDLIIAIDSASLDFTVKAREKLFQATPVIFGMPQQDFQAPVQQINVTGVIARSKTTNYQRTLEMVLRLHPGTRRIVLVAGTDEMSLNRLEKVKTELASYENKLEFIWLTNMPMETILSRLRQLQKDTIVFYVFMLQDATGKTFIPKAAGTLIAQMSIRPVYGFWDALLGTGIVGGNMNSSRMLGAKTAELGLRVLRGESAQDIPIVLSDNTNNMFDWNQLNRWNIKESALPLGSSVLFKTDSIYEKYKWYVIFGIVLCVVEFMLIFSLVINRTKRLGIEQELRNHRDELENQVQIRTQELEQQKYEFQIEKEKFQMLFEMASSFRALIEKETGAMLEINQAFIDHYGYTRNEVLTMKNIDFSAEPEKTQKSSQEKEPKIPLRWHKKKDGTVFPTEIFVNTVNFQGKEAHIVAIHDITDRKMAEDKIKASLIEKETLLQKIQSSQNRFKEMADLLPVGVVEMDAELKLTYINQAGFGILEYTIQDLQKGINGIELLHPDDREKAALRISDYGAGKYVPPTKYRILKKDGTEVPVVFKSIPINKENEIIGFRASITDISQLNKAEEGLLQKDYIIESASGAIATANLEGETTYVNPAFLKIWGFDDDKEILGKHFSEFWVVQERLDEIMRVLQSTSIWSDEIKARKKDGGLFDVQMQANMVFDSAGNPTAIMSTSLDITKRKKAEEQIKSSLKENETLLQTLKTERRRLADILDGTNVGTWEWNVQTGETIFNERWAEIIGYTLEEISPVSIETWVKFSHPDDLRVSNELLEKHFNGELDYYDCETRMKHKNGDWIWVQDRGKVVTWSEDRKPLLVSGTHQDITVRKQLDEQIKASLKEKETLLHEIHHRVKNNMAVISSLLGMQMNSTDNKLAKEALQDSQNRVQSMSMIHETLYRSDSLSSIDLKTYLSELGRTIFQNYSLRNKVQFKVEAENIMIGVKQASPVGLIVNELISNCLKYAFSDDREGVILLELKSNKENGVELIVSDNGVGIPEGFDLQNTDSLGLKLVKLLAENQLGGSLDMESSNGTKFIIKFNIET